MNELLDLTKFTTEQRNQRTMDLDTMTSLQIVTTMNDEDLRAVQSVTNVLPQVATAIDWAAEALERGGRVFYMGAGTSGRLGVLDASEIPPTFGMDPGWIIGIIAGGDTALRNAVENAEDDTEQGWKDLQEFNITPLDTVVGIAASGTTPYVIGALKAAREFGCLTGAITSNPDAPMSEAAEIAMEMVVGPEFVTGSSRMKSGTGQKLICNMISTSVMIMMGRVKGNKMVNMQLSNIKLVDRGTRMVVEELGLPYEEAKTLLLKYGSVKKACDAYRANQ